MKTLTIVFGDKSKGDPEFDVLDDAGRSTGSLTIGEVIEQIMFMHFEKRERYPMKIVPASEAYQYSTNFYNTKD